MNATSQIEFNGIILDVKYSYSKPEIKKQDDAGSGLDIQIEKILFSQSDLIEIEEIIKENHY